MSPRPLQASRLLITVRASPAGLTRPRAASPALQAAPGEVKYTAVGRRKTASAKVYIVPGAWLQRWQRRGQGDASLYAR